MNNLWKNKQYHCVFPLILKPESWEYRMEIESRSKEMKPNEHES